MKIPPSHSPLLGRLPKSIQENKMAYKGSMLATMATKVPDNFDAAQRNKLCDKAVKTRPKSSNKIHV